MVEVRVSRGDSNHGRAVEVGTQFELVKYADNREPLFPEQHLWLVRQIDDPEAFGCNGTENRDRILPCGFIEEPARGQRSSQCVDEIEIDRLNTDSPGLSGRDVIGSVDTGIDGAHSARSFNRPDPRHHRCRIRWQYTRPATDAATRFYGQKVGSQSIKLSQQIRLARLREPQNGHHRRDADHDAKSRESGSQLSRPQPDRSGAGQVGAVEATGLEGDGHQRTPRQKSVVFDPCRHGERPYAGSVEPPRDRG